MRPFHKQHSAIEQVSLLDAPAAIFNLAANEIHVWRADLEQPAAVVSDLAQLLSADEQTRAAGFHFERDRRRFIVRRGRLRQLLGRYLGVAPAGLQFAYGPYGKPFLVTDAGLASLHFSLSHAHELALYAVTRTCPVGIDLEYVRPIDEAAQIVARFFSAEERAHYHALPARQRLAWFFACWTQKEARYKASGQGLTELEEIAPHEGLTRLVQTCRPAPGYVAALAVAGPEPRLSPGWQVRFWNLSLDDPRHFGSTEI